MTATYDITTDVGKIRALCGDTNMSDPLLFDEEIESFLTLEGSAIKLAAATAIETIATRQVLLLKVVTVMGGDLKTDGRAVAEALHKRSEELRRQYAEDDVDNGGFDIAEQILGPFSYKEKLYNIFLTEQ